MVEYVLSTKESLALGEDYEKEKSRLSVNKHALRSSIESTVDARKESVLAKWSSIIEILDKVVENFNNMLNEYKDSLMFTITVSIVSKKSYDNIINSKSRYGPDYVHYEERDGKVSFNILCINDNSLTKAEFENFIHKKIEEKLKFSEDFPYCIKIVKIPDPDKKIIFELNLWQ